MGLQESKLAKLEFSDAEAEDIEELRMLSGFDVDEIVRVRKLFNEWTINGSILAKSTFLLKPGIINNPLRERICYIFGYTDSKLEIDIKQFFIGLSLFNAPGQLEQKLKTAYQIQDIDNDGQISKDDLTIYLKLVTNNKLDSSDIMLLVDKTFDECSSHLTQEFLNYADFQRVVAPTDFHLKMHLTI